MASIFDILLYFDSLNIVNSFLVVRTYQSWAVDSYLTIKMSLYLLPEMQENNPNILDICYTSRYFTGYMRTSKNEAIVWQDIGDEESQIFFVALELLLIHLRCLLAWYSSSGPLYFRTSFWGWIFQMSRPSLFIIPIGNAVPISWWCPFLSHL